MPIAWSESKWAKRTRKWIHFSAFCMYPVNASIDEMMSHPVLCMRVENKSERIATATAYSEYIYTFTSIHILYTHTRIKNPSLLIQFRLYTEILFKRIKWNIATAVTPSVLTARKSAVRHALWMLPASKFSSERCNYEFLPKYYSEIRTPHYEYDYFHPFSKISIACNIWSVTLKVEI